MIVDKINKYLYENDLIIDDAIRYEVEKMAGWVFKRQFMENNERDNKGKLYLSSAGKCARQLAYGYHGYEKAGREIDGRAKIIFWTGDLVELTVVNLAKLAGVTLTATGFNQIALKFQVNGTHIEGHPDGIVIENKEMYLLEVKSMSSYRFRDFEKGNLDETYSTQINCYMEGLGLSKCVVVAINKDNGVMGELVINKDKEVVESARMNLLSVMKSTPEKLPEPKYTYDEKTRFYPWQCMYCSYYQTCHPNSEVVLVKNSNKLREKNGSDTSGEQNRKSNTVD